MSNLQRRTNASFAVRNWLDKQGFDVSGKGKKLNEFMVEFLKYKKLKYEKWNPRYKGLFTADVCNADVIQEHWQEFKEFIKNKLLTEDK